MSNTELTLHAPAKINWTLRIVRRRPDGFHDIESLVSTITLSDALTFQLRDDGVELACDQPGIPLDSSNLVWKAATLLRSRCCRATGVSCHLAKGIPAGGGLGGGSSDAAATLQACNRMWSAGFTQDDLMSLAGYLGSDVPFFLRGGSAVMAGRGERLMPASIPWKGWIVLLLPSFPISTAQAYTTWKPCAGPDLPVLPNRRPSDAVEWMNWTFNMLEEPAMEIRPVLRELRDQASRVAARPVRMSGSGSTLFTAFDDKKEAETFACRIGQSLDLETRVVQTTRDA